VNELFNTKHRLNENERKDTLHRVFEHDLVQSDLLEITQKAKDVERLSMVLENVKYAYAHMARTRSNDNVVYRNALIFAVVSNKHRASQHFLSTTIGASR
jgi:hypothetical protein